MSLILASKSPRRQELMHLITDDFGILTADTDETVNPLFPVCRTAQILAKRKAKDVQKIASPGDIVIGADTVVVIGDEILGKPRSDEEAFAMLKKLSGKKHDVYTGVSIVKGGFSLSFTEQTTVVFRRLTDGQILEYIATGEPMDKAGAYGIQGKGSVFVRGISGDYFNVMGLPVSRLASELAKLKKWGF